ncbi:transporter [Thalassotalea fonticola]|uniref:Transporter n=1 Tax=Thalassotalea fonticola TaxID=3065649 RepID=A0ABZ0GS67_9GAMM|nr:transporter [Colwelliaceae bacterium S1-1]
MIKVERLTACLCSLILLVSFFSQAQENKELAQEIANPLTTMIMVPVQFEYNENIGPVDDGTRSTIFVQPIIPFELSEDWNLITRTIVPIIQQDDIFPGAGSQQGIGDISESLFFSPDKPTENGWITGYGPYLQFDSATDDYLGFEEHGFGGSFIALRVDGSKTYGFLANQVYSAEGHIGGTYSNTFIQPFFDYTTEGAMTIELTSETNYNWNNDEWSIPLTLTASQFFMVGEQPILVGGGFKYWLESAPGDPEGMSLNLNLYLLFPK